MGININFWRGLAMLGFGLIMITFGQRADNRVWAKYSNGLKWRGLGFSPSSFAAGSKKEQRKPNVRGLEISERLGAIIGGHC
jgi:hypothetical protein